MDDLKKLIREIPDHPKPGILFYDITTLLADADGLRTTVDRFIDLLADTPVDKVVGMESRGFLFAPILAYELGAGFVPVRKPGKLPGRTRAHEYDLEYGSDRLEMHIDGIREGERVLIVDDLIATGGTAKATAGLVEAAGGRIAGFGFVIELDGLKGRTRLEPHAVRSLIHY